MSREMDDSNEFSEPKKVGPEICPGCNKCSHGLRDGISKLGCLNLVILLIASATLMSVCSLRGEVSSQKSELSEIKNKLNHIQGYTDNPQGSDKQLILKVPRYVEEHFIR